MIDFKIYSIYKKLSEIQWIELHTLVSLIDFINRSRFSLGSKSIDTVFS